MAYHDDEEHEEHTNHEAWVLPYADMLTLLMALFLVLFAMGRVDIARFEELAASLGSELRPGSQGGEPAPTGDAAPGGADATPDVELTADGDPVTPPSLVEVEEAIAAAAVAQGVEDELEFRTDARGLVVTILSDRILFASGSSDLQPAGRQVLAAVSDALHDLDNEVVIEGHTDDRPIDTGRFPSNWELSTSRAAAVLRLLSDDLGLPAERLSAAGYADQREVGDNTTESGRARNRRVELVVVAGEEDLAVATASAPASEVTPSEGR